MAVLDSPLNKSGRVKVYIHTEKNVLVEVNSKCRIPRTFKRFSGLMGKCACACSLSMCLCEYLMHSLANKYDLTYSIRSFDHWLIACIVQCSCCIAWRSGRRTARRCFWRWSRVPSPDICRPMHAASGCPTRGKCTTHSTSSPPRYPMTSPLWSVSRSSSTTTWIMWMCCSVWSDGCGEHWPGGTPVCKYACICAY